ncbi:PREDICTED: pectinesterase [Prunus dulcis]|uniref:Pectinesterase n=1 Tax=Prunus dulcis TaxID=3755 RepID=A0A5E4GCA5_PRUDU|nr:PREDICTED: pectinesterase [Prunus dulcis]
MRILDTFTSVASVKLAGFRAVTAIHANCWGTIGAKVADLTAVVDDWKRFKSLSNSKTITDAVNRILAGNTKSVIVYIGGGEYNEKITILRNKPFVIFYGSPTNMPTLTFASTFQKYGTVNSATVIVEADYFVATNLIIKVQFFAKAIWEKSGVQTVALRVSGNKSALYNCRLIGFQDTRCDDMGNHFFKDCYIEGTVDFIFGSGKSINTNSKEDELESALYKASMGTYKTLIIAIVKACVEGDKPMRLIYF